MSPPLPPVDLRSDTVTKPSREMSEPETNIVMLDLVREADSSETVIPRLARLIAEVLR